MSEIDELRAACAAQVADDIREHLADEPAEVRESAVRMALAHPAVADMIEGAAHRLAGRLN